MSQQTIELSNVYPLGNQHHLTIIRIDKTVEKRNWWNVNEDNPIVLNDGDSLLGDDKGIDNCLMSSEITTLIQRVEIVNEQKTGISSLDDLMNYFVWLDDKAHW